MLLASRELGQGRPVDEDVQKRQEMGRLRGFPQQNLFRRDCRAFVLGCHAARACSFDRKGHEPVSDPPEQLVARDLHFGTPRVTPGGSCH